jgi:hypothetical protein
MGKHALVCSIGFALLLAIPTVGAADAMPSAMPPFAQELDMDIDAVLQRLQLDSKGLTPTVKEFDRDWVKSLFVRGKVFGQPSPWPPVGGLSHKNAWQESRPNGSICVGAD